MLVFSLIPHIIYHVSFSLWRLREALRYMAALCCAREASVKRRKRGEHERAERDMLAYECGVMMSGDIREAF